jgi:hypothetical protein
MTLLVLAGLDPEAKNALGSERYDGDCIVDLSLPRRTGV